MKRLTIFTKFLFTLMLTTNYVGAQDDETKLNLELQSIQKDFLLHCEKGDFDSAQELLHPWGCYFFHHGKVPPCMFDHRSLEKIANPLFKWGEGDCHEMGNDIISSAEIVNGLFWIDTLQSFTRNTPRVYDNYVVMGYGFSGHYSSDHIDEDKILDNHPNEFDEKPIRVLYTDHNTFQGHEVLMMEFFQDDEGNWKIYAIGELYWTP